MKAKVFLKSNPMCCFCGGTEVATTIEHLPARIVFPKKHRPKGLEFPACAICNDQTRGDDSVLSVVARAVGSMRPGFPSFDEATLKRAAAGIHRNYPGFKFGGQQGMRMVNGVIRQVGVIDLNDPIILRSLCRLAAKFALAIFYQVFLKPADERYRINTFWVHNQNPGATDVADILRQFPNTASLKQGSWDTSETFFYRHAQNESGIITAAIYYESVLLYGQVGLVHDTETWTPLRMTWGPVAKSGLVEMPIARALKA